MASASREIDQSYEIDTGLDYFDCREVELLLEEDEIESARELVGDNALADEILPTTSEDIIEGILYIHEIHRSGTDEDYREVRDSIKSDAVDYLTENGLNESVAEDHASELAVDAAIGHTYEALDTVRAWCSLIEGKGDF